MSLLVIMANPPDPFCFKKVCQHAAAYPTVDTSLKLALLRVGGGHDTSGHLEGIPNDNRHAKRPCKTESRPCDVRITLRLPRLAPCVLWSVQVLMDSRTHLPSLPFVQANTNVQVSTTHAGLQNME